MSSKSKRVCVAWCREQPKRFKVRTKAPNRARRKK